MAVHVDGRGDVWFGTESGLVRLTQATGAWDRFTVADGLGHDTVMGILEDDEHRLWVSTIRGVTRVSPMGARASFLTSSTSSPGTGSPTLSSLAAPRSAGPRGGSTSGVAAD
jgi:ligand-binding sensor domain-containing protein